MGQYFLGVVGADLGGLLTAALVSAKGKRSFICTAGTSLAEALGTVQKDGFSFSTGPALSYSLEQDGVLQRVLTALGITDLAPERAIGYQVALPDRRITVASRQEETLDEIRREFPSDVEMAVKFYHDLKVAAERISNSRVATYLSKYKSAQSFLRDYKFSREFLAFLDVQAIFFFHCPVMELAFPALLKLCGHRPSRFYGLYEKIAARLIDIVLRKGGNVRFGESLVDIVYRSNQTIGIRTAREDVEVSSMLLRDYEKSMPVLFLGIRDEVVPVGMGRDVLYLPDYSEPRNFLALALSEKGDHAAAPHNMRALTTSFYTDKKPGRLPDMLVEQIADLIPYLKDFIILSGESLPAAAEVPKDLTFKPLRSGSMRSAPLLFKASRRNVHMLREVYNAPDLVIQAVERLVARIT